MRRLYLKIYLAFVGILVVFVCLSAAIWWHTEDGSRRRDILRGGAVALELALPAETPPAQAEARLAKLSEALGVRLALFDAAGARLTGDAADIPSPDVARGESHWIHKRRRGALAALRLSDGRWVVVSSDRHRPPGLTWLLNLALLAGLIAAGAYPVARGITRRIERLTARVDDFGGGALHARAEVEGRDEVARLAERFNHAADRIETLLASQRSLLASTSHELRSPLARLRMAVELLGERADPKLRAQVERDVSDLDAALDELLAVSRLDLLDASAHSDTLDFLALVAEEAARFDVEVEGEPVTLRGDARSLRHLVRNLLANARRHAPDAPVRVRVEPLDGGGARLEVADRGPGVPEAERGRIFEPFARGAASTRHAGVGLGLAIVQQVARHHGGEARVFDREGGGCRFEVTLPGR
jgi:signal transduction histidine kinase